MTRCYGKGGRETGRGRVGEVRKKKQNKSRGARRGEKISETRRDARDRPS